MDGGEEVITAKGYGARLLVVPPSLALWRFGLLSQEMAAMKRQSD